MISKKEMEPILKKNKLLKINIALFLSFSPCCPILYLQVFAAPST